MVLKVLRLLIYQGNPLTHKDSLTIGSFDSTETKQKISIGVSGENNSNFGKLGGKHQSSKNIYQYSLDGVFIKEYGGAREAARCIGGLQSNISSCARGDIKSAYGFKWSYTTE